MKIKFFAAAAAALAFALTGCEELDSCSVSTMSNMVYLDASIDDYTVDGSYAFDSYGYAYATLTYTYPNTADASYACSDAYAMYGAPNVSCSGFSVTIMIDFPYAYTMDDLRVEANAQCDALL